MSSILTNNSAMVALQTLKSINKNLAMTQNEISTGKSISSAKDNSAVWAISKVMESDVAGFKAVSESLALGESTVAVARNAAETVTDLLTEMKGRIVAAQEENVDRDAIQEDIVALRDQISSVVGAAQFNGLNLIDGTSTDALSILSSLDRASDGSVSDRQIEVDRQSLAVTGSVSAQALGTTAAGTATAGGGDQDVANEYIQAGTDNTNFALATDYDRDDNTTATSTLADGGTLDFTFSQVAEGVSYSITIDDLNINTADGSSTLGIRTFEYVATADDSVNDVARQLGNQIQSFFDAATSSTEGYSVAFDPAGTGDDNVFRINNAAGGGTDNVLFFVEVSEGGTPGASGTDGLAAVQTLDVTTDTGATNALGAIDNLIQTSIDAAASFGSAQTQIETQSSFISQLSDDLKTGIGALVDADMEEVSARLQALQTQQQLGVQSLSIANQAPQTILSLFR
ncbi:MAG: flagellin [Pseudomonadota bacterium]